MVKSNFLSRLLVLTTLVIVAWWLAAWFIADYQFGEQVNQVVAQHTNLNQKRSDDLSRSIKRNLHYMSGIPEMLSHLVRVHNATELMDKNFESANISYAERKRKWTQNPQLNDLSLYLEIAQTNLNVDLIYLVNAAGDCIASSHWNQSGSPIGTNYAERDFFLANKTGNKGMQYAMGKTTHLPGLYFSSPVLSNGRFMGAVVAKLDVANLLFITQETDALIADKNGVIILAYDKAMEMHAMPNAPVLGMSDEQKIAHYQRSDIVPLPMISWGSRAHPELLKNVGDSLPYVLASRALSEYGLTVYTREPLHQLPTLERERSLQFWLLAIFGSVLIVAGCGALFFLNTVRKAKEVLSESEQHLSMTLKYSPEAVFICKQDGRIEYTNENVRNIFGYNAQELALMSIFDLFPSDSREQYKGNIQQMLSDEHLHHVVEIRLAKKNGEQIPMELSAVLLPNGSVYGSCRDISERKLAEAEIARSKKELDDERELFHRILDNAPIGIWMLDVSGRVKFVNRTYCNALGISEQAFQSAQHYSELLPPAMSASCVISDRECFSGVSPHHSVENAPFVDNKNHLMEVTKVRLYDAANEVAGLIGLAVDVTDIKQSEAMRSGQTKVLEMIATDMPLSATLDAVVKLVESQAQGMFGSILLLDEDGVHLRHGAAPSLPIAYVNAINGAAIGSSAGSCGTAAYRKEPVYVEDIATDPLWADYRELALSHGLRACWSTPIFDLQHRVIGTFAMYYKQPCLPQPAQLQLIDIATQTVTIALNRHLAENALRRSETAFRTLFEASHDAFILVQPDGIFLDGNQAAISMFGCRDEQAFLALTFGACSPELQPDGCRSDEKSHEMMQLAFKNGSHVFEWTHCRMDGTAFFAEVLLTRMEIDEKVLIQATVRDISRRKQEDLFEQQRQDELQALYLLSDAVSSAASLEQIFDVSMNFMLSLLKANRCGILLADSDGVMQFKARRGLSDAYCAALGGYTPWAKDAVDRQPVFIKDILAEEKDSVLGAQMAREGIHGLAFIPLMQHGRLLGQFMVCFDTQHTFSDAEMQLGLTIASHVSFAIDRKLAEQQFVDIFQFAPDAIVLTDTDAIIKLINRQAEHLFGYTSQELIGQTIDVLIPHDRSNERRDMRQRFLSSAMRPRPLGAMVRKDLRGVNKAGEIFPVELSLSPMESPNGKMIAAAIRDVSGRKQVMDQLLSTAAELENANAQITQERAMLAQRVTERTTQLLLANKAKDSFLATMSHEIRTPLGGLLGMMELLSLSTLDSAQAEMLQTAQNSGKSLLRIVDDILDWSKIEAGKLHLAPRTSSIVELLKGVSNTYAQVASAKGVLLHYRVDPKLSAAHLFDPLRMSQILNNFTSNALKFTGQGDVEISAVLLNQHDGNEEIRFSVRDSGIGIEKEQQTYLFQQYEQASKETARMYGGTGLGLAICSRLAELMGGTIGLESRPEVGSIFYVTVNFSVANQDAQRELQFHLDNQHAEVQKPDVTALLEHGQHRTVLVVDDHPVNRILLKQQLEQLGLHVVVAESGIIGLSMWWSGQFNLILTDCHMPGMDGYELTRSIREIELHDSRPRVPIIAWTANVLAEEEVRCLAAGMDDVLTKPTELSVLRAMLLKWLFVDDAHVGLQIEPSIPPEQTAMMNDESDATMEAAIDFDVLKKFARNPAMQAEMLNEFNIHNRIDIAHLNALLKDGNPLSVGHAAHRIKGACRMVGAVQLEGVCARIETAARSENMQEARLAAEHVLNAAVTRVEAVIGKFLRQHESS